MSRRSRVARVRALLVELPVVVSAMLIGSVVLGALGGVVGLVLGLHAHPGTAWFAVLEVGAPAGVVGGILGLVVGVIVHWVGAGTSRRRTPVDDDFAGTPPGW